MTCLNPCHFFMFIFLETSSPAKEKIVNDNFLIQEAWNKGIIDRTLSTPPGTPSSDGLYVPVAAGTGAWTGQENKLIWWNPTGAWQVIEVTGKFKLSLQNEPAYYVFDGGVWSLERYQTIV